MIVSKPIEIREINTIFVFKNSLRMCITYRAYGRTKYYFYNIDSIVCIIKFEIRGERRNMILAALDKLTTSTVKGPKQSDDL